MKMFFEIPDSRCTEESTYPKMKYCPKCYQERHFKHHQGESVPDHKLHAHPHAMTDTVKEPVKDLSSAFQAIEETIMDSYPPCKKICLSLFVNKDRPKDKLDLHVLTCRVISEVASFYKRLCGTKTSSLMMSLNTNLTLA